MLVCFETFSFEVFSFEMFLEGVLHAIVATVVVHVVHGACMGKGGVCSGGKKQNLLNERCTGNGMIEQSGLIEQLFCELSAAVGC